ncbi:hypothetical protein QGX15_gp058 [Pseudomonas phage psageK4e]|uniref:Uncharacterized protein n=1 Tax=Pseudomonas phage psageK4e TaxID=2875723 RepID=A0AAE9BSQ7_9CAUD|nr:hypothetical protein QGX15_gp058 [Pseudomonas phage psageK4e]UAW53506.1 hypothetical protein psageK4e_058 [Pseudomonas phage psageK4e]
MAFPWVKSTFQYETQRHEQIKNNNQHIQPPKTLIYKEIV